MRTSRPRVERRTPEAGKYRKLYKTPGWRSLRRRKLKTNPLCERCEAKGFVVPATVVNHRIPHKGDLKLFWDWDNLESACADCHDGPIQSEERTGRPNDRVGYVTDVLDCGLPADNRHPFFGRNG